MIERDRMIRSRGDRGGEEVKSSQNLLMTTQYQQKDEDETAWVSEGSSAVAAAAAVRGEITRDEALYFRVRAPSLNLHKCRMSKMGRREYYEPE